MKNVKFSVVLTSPSVLVPVYQNESNSLGKHRDTFGGRPEYVINIYFGDQRILNVECINFKLSSKLLCDQDMVRIFHPLFNDIFLHEKKKSVLKRNTHYCNVNTTSRNKEYE